LKRHRHNASDFTRRSIFTFERVVGVLLATLMRSIQVELDQFFAHIELPEGRIARDDAFRMARKKLNWSAFTELNQAIVADVSTTARWHGYRVVAADSTTLMLPTHHPDTISADKGFNCYHHSDGIYALARGGGLCDVATGLMLRADIDSDSKGEREMLLDQLDSVFADDLLVLDRGYPSYWLFALLNQQGRAFCMRATTSFNAKIKAFVASGQASQLITVKPGHDQIAAFKRHNLPLKPFTIRLVRVVLPGGMIEVLITNLEDEIAYPAAEFAELYHRRWRIEEAFRHIKCRLHLEQFGGETPLAIRQEFHATILLHNLATLAAMDVKDLREDSATLSVNLTHASHMIRHHLPLLLSNPLEQATLCQILLERMVMMITRRRMNRQGPPRQPDREKPHPCRAYK